MRPQSELERAAAAWLTARASGDVRRWRDASTKLDAALKAATLQLEPPTERNP